MVARMVEAMASDGSTRVLVATEPRAYRETIAAALRGLRPSVEVVVAEPDELDAALACHRPHLVLCSRCAEAIGARLLAWVELYPGGMTRAMVNVAGRQTTFDDLPFDRLLAVVDEADSLARAG